MEIVKQPPLPGRSFVEHALWTIESRLDQALELGQIARAAHVSRHHLARAFAHATGRPVMDYVRARRLTEAARALAAGAPSIIEVALDAGYGSHEAFSRAFRREFGTTPEALRAGGAAALSPLQLQEPMMTSDTNLIDLPAPRIETGPARTIAGLSDRYRVGAVGEISGLWRRLGPHIGTVPGEVPGATYGVCGVPDADGAFDYLAGVEVTGKPDLPPGFTTLKIDPGRFAVFTHAGQIAEIRHTWHSIFAGWLPGSGERLAEAPSFELYDRRFDPESGTGEVDIWIPLAG